MIREAINENIRGGLRRVRDGKKQQFNTGYVEDENKELSFFEAELAFPGSTGAWAEIVPELFPDFPFTDPSVIKRKSLFFRIGNKLRVSFESVPQLELAEWDSKKEDWVELDVPEPDFN